MAEVLLTRPQESFAEVAEDAPAMLWRGDAVGKCVYLNRAQREFWGLSLPDVATFDWSSTLLPEDAPLVFGPFSDGMRNRTPFVAEGRYRRADGAVRILQTRAQPRFDADGTFTGMVGTNIDVTDERDARRAAVESETRLRALAGNLPDAMIYQLVAEADGRRRFTFVADTCEALTGVPAEAAMADASLLYGLIPPEHRPAMAEAEAAVIANGGPFAIEIPMRRADGETRWFRVASMPRRNEDGSVVWDGVQIDIHDRKSAELRQQLLMEELNHRVKNTLATVLSIATLTGRGAPSVESFNRSLQARLQALAKTHELLTRERWESADLREVLETELKPYVSDRESGRGLVLTGQPVRLSARASVSLALAIHELATNAAKYGAYARSGSIALSWTVEDSPEGQVVSLAWRESGGPAVDAPGRTGFGTRLVERLIEGDLAGAVERRFAGSGFEADLRFLAQGATA